MAELPPDLANRLREPEERSERNDSGWVGQALKGAPQGQRNQVAGKLAGFYINEGLSAGQVAVILKNSYGPNCSPPMDPDEIDGVVASVARTDSRRNGTDQRQRASTTTDERSDSVNGRGGGSQAMDHPVPKRPADFPLTDTGNAELIAYLFGGRLRFDHRQGRWLAWSKHHWMNDSDGAPVRLAIHAARVRYRDSEHILDTKEREKAAKWAIGSEARQRIDAALQVARNLPPIADSGEAWDTDPWFLGCKNGVLDLRNGKPRPGRPEDRITMSTGLAYEATAEARRFDQFLEEVFAGDVELISFVNRAHGYSITGDVSEQVVFLCHGSGANGKTTKFAHATVPIGAVHARDRYAPRPLDLRSGMGFRR